MKNLAVNNFFIYVAVTTIQKSINFIAIPFYTAILSPAEFGIVNQVIAVGALYILIATFAIDEASARYYFKFSNEKSAQRELVNSLILFSLFVAVLISIALYMNRGLAYLKLIPEASEYLIFASIAIVLVSPINAIYQKLLRIQEKAIKFSIVVLLTLTTQLLLSYVLILKLDLGSDGYILALAIASVTLFIYSLYSLKVSFKVKFKWELVRGPLKYALSIMPHTLSSWGLASFTIVFLGFSQGVEVVGLFVAILYIGIIFNALSDAALNAFQPWLYKKLQTEESVFDVIKFFALSFAYIGGFLSIFSEDIVHLLLNERYHSALFISPYIILTSTTLFFGSIFSYVLYYHIEHTKYIAVATLTGVVTNIVLTLLLVPNYGMLGAVLSLLISTVIIGVLKTNYASKISSWRHVPVFQFYFLAFVNMLAALYINSVDFDFYNKVIIFLLEGLLLYFLYRKLIIKVARMYLDTK